LRNGAEMAKTLFDKYGGVPAVTVIVRDFYKRVMRRPNLRSYFVNVSLENLILQQIAFVSMAMGKAPNDYAGRSMRDAHRGIGITKASFDLAAELLADTLTAGGVEPDGVAAIGDGEYPSCRHHRALSRICSGR
jgi:hemoglobin